MLKKINNVEKSNTSVGLSALAMAAGTMLSRILGLLRDIVLSYMFPVSITDAFLVAFRLSNSLRRIFGEGAMAAAFVPQYVEKQKEDQNQSADANEIVNAKALSLASGVFSVLFLILCTASVLGIIYSESLMQIFASGKAFSEIAGKFELAVRMSKIMFFFLFFICTYAFYMAILNVHKKFFWPALAPAFFNLIMIVFACLPESLFAVKGDSLAYGVLIGGAVQMLLLVPPLLKMNALPRLSMNLDSGVFLVFKNMLPSLISLGILQIITLINTRFASNIENGANSWMYYADRILELPLSLIGVSMGAALLPSLSRFWSDQDKKSFASTLNYALRFSYFLIFPAMFATYFLAPKMIYVFFARGHFTDYDVMQTSSVLQVYAFAIFGFGSLRILNSAFYATKSFWTPVFCTVLSLILHLSIVLSFGDSLSINKLALSTVISGLFSFLLLLIILHYKVGNFGYDKLFRSIAKSLFASLMMCLLFYIERIYVSELYSAAWHHLLALILLVVFGSALYFFVQYLLKSEELGLFLNKLKERRQRNK